LIRGSFLKGAPKSKRGKNAMGRKKGEFFTGGLSTESNRRTGRRLPEGEKLLKGIYFTTWKWNWYEGVVSSPRVSIFPKVSEEKKVGVWSLKPKKASKGYE